MAAAYIESVDSQIDETTLLRAVSFFAEFHDFENGNQMVALCDTFSERFIEFLHSLAQREGRPPGTSPVDEYRPFPDIYPDNGEDHCVVRLGPYIYDWTIRQYTEATAVPFIWPADRLSSM